MTVNQSPTSAIESGLKEKKWADVAFDSQPSVLEDLKSNLDQLEELHSRLQYMLGEIKTLIRR